MTTTHQANTAEISDQQLTADYLVHRHGYTADEATALVESAVAEISDEELTVDYLVQRHGHTTGEATELVESAVDAHRSGLTGWFNDRLQSARHAKARRQIAAMNDRELATSYLTARGYTADVAAEMVLNAELKSITENKPEIADRVESVTVVGHNTPPASFLGQVSQVLHPSYAGEPVDAEWITALEKVAAFVREHDRVPELQLTH